MTIASHAFMRAAPSSGFPYLLVFTQFRTENRFTLFLELLGTCCSPIARIWHGSQFFVQPY
ncbi:hypothetical protein FJ957_22730 [Mesorhizobium sp. B2-4-6]|nr:hypothetical protein FJ957_22730 [Mesorhizobium sp. B2-4-6]